jgi:hypothetical protein
LHQFSFLQPSNAAEAKRPVKRAARAFFMNGPKRWIALNDKKKIQFVIDNAMWWS